MTKIKNTKKGMAKKTLSVSLAVAMLATSNVPVWAAEFSDGADAAFTSEAPVEVEAPVVEDNTADVPEAQAMGDAWTVKLTDMPTEVEWGTTKDVTVEIKDVDENIVTTTSGLKYVWKSAGLAVDAPEDVTGTITTPTTTDDNIGNSYVLYIYDENGDYEYTSAPFTVCAKDVTKLGLEINVSNRSYTGLKTTENAEIDSDIDFEFDYTGDLVNVGTVNVSATPVNSKLYKGVIKGSFNIEPVNLAEAEDLVKATLKTTKVEYTGSTIILKKSDVNVIDVNTGADLNALVADNSTITTSVKDVNDGDNGESTATVTLTAVDSTKNFVKDSSLDVTTENKVKVVARDLSKVKVSIESKAKKSDGTAYTQDDLTITFKDANNNDLTLGEDIVVEGLDKAINYGTYTVTIKPAQDNKNVTGQTTAKFSIFSQNIEGATFSSQITAQEYTGSQIKPDVSKLNVVLGEDENGKDVVLDPADYTIEYGENTKAGTAAGSIYIVGKRTYEGSKAEVNFDINKATVSELKTSDYVIIDKDAKEAKDYAKAIGLVVKAKNAATPAKEFTLTEGTDYTVEYEYENADNENEVDNYVVVAVTLKPDGNFEGGEVDLSQKVRIASPILKDSDIKLKKTSYEYTGAVIVPEFDVVVGGKTLVKDTDYKIASVTNSAKVGTATLTIVGMGDFDAQVSAKADFTVTSVSAEKTVVAIDGEYEFDGTAKKPDLENITVTLNGNDVTSQFDVAYGENINAGKKTGTVIVTPKKDNKNFTAGTSQTGTFDINAKELEGTLKVYDERGIAYTISNNTIYKGDTAVEFEYDGTEKTFAKVVFVPTDSKATANDYEIRYVNNVTGGGDNGASIVVIAKRNYTADGTVNDNATGTAVEIKNVAYEVNFTIKSKLYFTEKEVTVTDAEYAESMLVKPVIVVKDGAKTLVEGVDYEVALSDNNNSAVNGATEVGFTGKWTVTGKGLYAATEDSNTNVNKNFATGTWKVVKKNVANLDIKVDLDATGNTVVTAMNGAVKVDAKNFDVKLSEDKKTATVSATTGNKNYIGSTDVTVGGEVLTVGTPMISTVKVSGNTATVVLSGDVEGAVGYDYVISTDRDCITSKDYDKVNKNILTTETSFSYVDQGVYYAYCHAWRRDENGKKVFGEWSNAYPFSVTSITPDQPVITSVKASGSTVTVTYTQSANATGYDVVLGTAVKKVNGETRPVNYGTLVKKNVKGNVVTATFKNVPAGSYYAGLHAFNRTSENGTKVFSSWSNYKKVTVK